MKNRHKGGSIIINKISDNSGETLGETLVSLLISALALVMLAGAISAASGIILRSRDRINNYYAQNSKIETQNDDDSAWSGKVTISNGPVDGFNVESQVLFFSNDALNPANPVVTYKLSNGSVSSGDTSGESGDDSSMGNDDNND